MEALSYSQFIELTPDSDKPKIKSEVYKSLKRVFPSRIDWQSIYKNLSEIKEFKCTPDQWKTFVSNFNRKENQKGSNELVTAILYWMHQDHEFHEKANAESDKICKELWGQSASDEYLARQTRKSSGEAHENADSPSQNTDAVDDKNEADDAYRAEILAKIKKYREPYQAATNSDSDHSHRSSQKTNSPDLKDLLTSFPPLKFPDAPPPTENDKWVIEWGRKFPCPENKQFRISFEDYSSEQPRCDYSYDYRPRGSCILRAHRFWNGWEYRIYDESGGMSSEFFGVVSGDPILKANSLFSLVGNQCKIYLAYDRNPTNFSDKVERFFIKTFTGENRWFGLKKAFPETKQCLTFHKNFSLDTPLLILPQTENGPLKLYRNFNLKLGGDGLGRSMYKPDWEGGRVKGCVAIWNGCQDSCLIHTYYRGAMPDGFILSCETDNYKTWHISAGNGGVLTMHPSGHIIEFINNRGNLELKFLNKKMTKVFHNQEYKRIETSIDVPFPQINVSYSNLGHSAAVGIIPFKKVLIIDLLKEEIISEIYNVEYPQYSPDGKRFFVYTTGRKVRVYPANGQGKPIEIDGSLAFSQPDSVRWCPTSSRLYFPTTTTIKSKKYDIIRAYKLSTD